VLVSAAVLEAAVGFNSQSHVRHVFLSNKWLLSAVRCRIWTTTMPRLLKV